MPQSDYLMWLHGKAVPTAGYDIGHSGSEYTYTAQDVINTGITNPNLGAGDKCGLHVEILEAFNTCTGITFWIVHGATATPTTKLSGRYFLLAALTAGKHYFIPMPPGTVLQYIAGYAEIDGSNPSTGQVLMYLGPNVDGAE